MIGTLPPIKGLSPYCYHLAKALATKIDLEVICFKSIQPDFLYSGGTKDETEASFQLKNVKRKEILAWYNPLSWIKAGIIAKGDVIHIQHWALYSSIMYCIILLIVKLRGKKSILTVHNITPHVNDKSTVWVDRLLNKLMFPFADVFIVHNQRNKEKLLDLYRIDDKSVFIITHGLLQPYQQLKGIPKNAAREHLNISLSKKIILFFGWGYKGLDDLLNALHPIKESTEEVTLIIAGQPLRDWEKYEEIIKKYNLEKYVIKKLGYISDSEIEYYFSAADLVALPYKEQPFDTHGGVAALALSFKKPLVVTDVGGLPEYVKDTRVIAKPGDINDIATKITLVLNDEALQKKLSKDAEELSQELSWEKIAVKTIGRYEKTFTAQSNES